MRIIGYIEHPILKITVFKMNNKLSVKLESGLYEQTYKFRESEHLKNVQDVQRLIDHEFVQSVEADFKHMHQRRMQAMGRFLPPVEEDEFDTLI